MPNVFVWNRLLSNQAVSGGGILRTHYYTAVQGDQPQGADWVFHTSRPLVETGRAVPGEVVRRLASMVKSNSPTTTRSDQ
jgi:hypothetical protein